MSSLLATRKATHWRKKCANWSGDSDAKSNYTVLAPKEFESRRARKDTFLENLWHNKRFRSLVPHEDAQAAQS